MKILMFLILCFASVAPADDFKTVDGKEFKNVTVSRVEPDGIVLGSSSGISKVYFNELPKEVQERFHYDAAKAAAYSSEQKAVGEGFRKQLEEARQKRAEEREKYWRENPTPEPHRQTSTNATGNSLMGSALDRPAYGQSVGAGSITPQFLRSEYTANELRADRMYGGRTFGMSGTIKSIFQSGAQTVVELFIPYDGTGTVKWMCCYFSNPNGLEEKRVGNQITVIGTVAGVRYNTLIIKDCHL